MHSSKAIGDIHFFLTGDESKLTNDSIYRKLEKKDGEIRNIYGPANAAGRTDYKQFAEDNNMRKPCISNIIETDTSAHVIFRVVDKEQFAIDIACVQALVGNKEITFEGTIKDWKD